MVPSRVTIYLHCIVGIGVYLFVDGLTQFRPQNVQEFFAYLTLALLGATLRIKIPSLRANVSTGFAFIIIGIANFSLGEAITIATCATVVQCLWHRKAKDFTRQVFFNASVTVIGVTIAYNPTHAEIAHGLWKIPEMLPMAGFLYFLTNTGLVSGMIALSEDEPFRAVWRILTLQVFAYYLVGGFIATLIVVVCRVWTWQSGILVLPVLYLSHRSYRTFLLRPRRAESN